jgi:GH35 family endo-1,4-beta-xylanase
MKSTVAAFAVLAAVAAQAEFKIDRKAMSEEYWNIWNDDVQKRIDADIEKYRKADGEFALEGVPDGAEVTVEQVSHAFFFGAHIFNYGQLGKKEWNDRYKELYGTLFNSATVAFYWRTLEPYPYAPRFAERYEDTENFWNNCPQPKEQAHWRRPAPDPVIDFLRGRGCRIHGHPLVWGNNSWQRPTWIWDSFCPESEKRALEVRTGVKIPTANWRLPVGVKDFGSDGDWCAAWNKVYKMLSEEELAAIVPTYIKAYNYFLEKRIRDIGERYGSRVDSWDVVNESARDYEWRFGGKAVRGRPFDASRNGPMPADYAFKAFKWAMEYLPATARLYINDFHMAEGYVRQMHDLIAGGARIDAMGMQMHLFNPRECENIAQGLGPEHLRPEKIAGLFEMLSRAGRPIHLSEVTISAPDNTPRGQMVQAIVLRNLYRAWFAVERMEGITWWNVVDGCGAKGEPAISGLFTRDMQPKAAYFAMDDLVNREWKTTLSAHVAEGKVVFRGFRGTYRLSWTDPAGKAHNKIVEVK